MGDHATTALATLVVVTASFLLTYAGSAIGLIVALGGLGAASARYREMLRGMPDVMVRHATARGFFHGAGIAFLVLLADALIEVYS